MFGLFKLPKEMESTNGDGRVRMSLFSLVVHLDILNQGRSHHRRPVFVNGKAVLDVVVKDGSVNLILED